MVVGRGGGFVVLISLMKSMVLRGDIDATNLVDLMSATEMMDTVKLTFNHVVNHPSERLRLPDL